MSSRRVDLNLSTDILGVDLRLTGGYILVAFGHGLELDGIEAASSPFDPSGKHLHLILLVEFF